MKRFFGILKLILCLELIVGPYTPGLKIFSVAHADDTTCPTGLVFDSTLNRCITSDQQAEIINATASCNGDTECYKRIAEQKLQEAEADGKIPKEVANKAGLVGTVTQVAAIALPLTVALGSIGHGKCWKPSGIAMVAGGIAFTAGNFMADRKHKSCLKKIKDEWEKKKASTAETTQSGISKVSNAQAQSEAFEMLAKNEDCMASSAKMKAGFYAAATLAFGASAVLAMMEHASPDGGQGGCDGSNTDPAKPGDAATTNTTNAATTTTTDAAATTTTDAAATSSEVSGAGSTGETVLSNGQRVITPFSPPVEPSYKYENPVENYQFLPQFSYNLNNSSDVASYLAVNISMNNLSKKSCASIDDYKNIVEGLKDTSLNEDKSLLDFMKIAANGIISEFKLVDSAHAAGINLGFMKSSTTRAILSGILTGMTAMMWMHANKQAKVAKSRAEFLRKMKQDFNDANGAISCTAEERSMSANANCYCYTEDGQRNSSRTNSSVCQQLWSGQSLAQAGTYNGLDFSGQRVCISSNGAPDENCACAQNRSCLNAIPSATGSLGLGAISVASNGLKPLNDLSNGQIGAGSINGAAALSAAAKLLDQKNKMAAKAGLNPAAQAKLSKQIQDGIMAAGAGGGTPALGMGSSSPFPMNMTPAQAAQQLERELGGRSFESIKGSPAVAQPGNSNPGSEPGFSLGNPEAVAPTTDQQVAEVMGQDFNYGQNDITKSDSNLFQILSNRYQRSGMRRLFDDQQTTAADPANKKDITP